MIEKNDKDSAVRLDKWLWAARFYKTRALARQMIEGGKIEYNGFRAKPSKIVEKGALIKLLQGNVRREVLVLGISSTRGSATIAQTLYEETQESISERARLQELHKMAALIAPHPDTKPNKKERRKLLLLKQKHFQED